MDKIYLGDGVYGVYTGYSFILTTEDGVSIQNTIHLEPDVPAKLIEIMEKANAEN